MTRRWSRLTIAAATMAALVAAVVPAAAQESQIASDLRREREHLAESCEPSGKGVAMCAYSLLTESPLHVAFGVQCSVNAAPNAKPFCGGRLPTAIWSGLSVSSE